MGEPAAIPHQLSLPETNLLLLLDTAGITMTASNGSVRWALDADDVCDMLALAHELIADWNAKTPRETYRRATHLLDVPIPAAPDGCHGGRPETGLAGASASAGWLRVLWRRWLVAVSAVLGALLAVRFCLGRRTLGPAVTACGPRHDEDNGHDGGR
jgi:hypothetical protein